jgi:hypothetical protein
VCWIYVSGCYGPVLGCLEHISARTYSKVWNFLFSWVTVNFSGTQVHGFKPGRSIWIFREKKFSARLPWEGKYSRRSHVAALRLVKNPYNCRGSRKYKLNLLGHFSPIVLPFTARGLSRHLCAERAWRRQVRPKAGWYYQPIGCTAHGGKTHRPYSKGRKKERKKERRTVNFLK